MAELQTIQEQKIETRGRPKLPENIIKELQAEILKLKHDAENANEPMEQMKALSEIVRIIQRAMKGLPAEDDVFLGLIDPKNIRERTRLDEVAVLGHSAMRVAAKWFPRLDGFTDLAEEEDHYYISQDGAGRIEGVLLQQAKTKIDSANITNLTMPGAEQPQQQPQNPQQPHKKGVFSKLRGHLPF